MKASLKWLKDYVDITIKPEALAKELIMSGIHVASIQKEGDDVVFEFESLNSVSAVNSRQE